MLTGSRFFRSAEIIVLFFGIFHAVYVTGQDHPTKKVHPQSPAPASGSTGPLQPIPLDSTEPVAPHVTYENGQLTIVAENSTLAEILTAVREKTGVQVDIPDARERVVTHLGPGTAKEIIAQLLNGSKFNYVLLSSRQDGVLRRVVITDRSVQAAVTPTDSSQPTTAVDAQGDLHPRRATYDSNPDSNDVASRKVAPSPGAQSLSITEQEQMEEMQQSERQQPLQQQQARHSSPSPGPTFSVPEVDVTTGMSAAALLISTILIFRGRRGF